MRLLFSLFMLCLIGCAQAQSPAPQSSTPAARPSAGSNIVFVGDSNTENGFVTGALAQALEAKYGRFGSGWRSLVESVARGHEGSYSGGVTVKNEGTWKSLNIAPQGDKDAFLSPAGTALQSDDPAAVTTVEFEGRAIEVFYASHPGGGSFTASLNGAAAQTIDTAAADAKAASVVKKITLTADAGGPHTLALRPANGSVTLLGVNAISVEAARGGAVVHKWGRGYAESRQFLSIAPSVWSSGLQLVQPDIVVFMLGTNDHNISSVSTQVYLSNMTQLVAHTRAAMPEAKVLLLSTIPAGVWPSVSLGEQYARELPQLAKVLDVKYFDVWNWAGGAPEGSTKAVVERGLAPASDGIHWNAEGGRQLAAAILPVIEELAAQKAQAAPSEVLAKVSGATTDAALKAAIAQPVLGQIGLWLSADGALQLDTQNRVARWANARDNPSLDAASQLISKQRPMLVKNVINGLPALDFNGESTLLALPQSVSFRAYTFVARIRKPGGALLSEGRTHFRHFGSGAASENGFFAPEVLDEMKKRSATTFVNGSATAPDQLKYPLGEWQIITVDVGGHQSARLIGHNQWHRRYSDEKTELSSWWDGEIAEMVFFVNVFDAARREAVEKYLSRKYNIALSTPAQP